MSPASRSRTPVNVSEETGRRRPSRPASWRHRELGPVLAEALEERLEDFAMTVGLDVGQGVAEQPAVGLTPLLPQAIIRRLAPGPLLQEGAEEVDELGTRPARVQLILEASDPRRQDVRRGRARLHLVEAGCPGSPRPDAGTGRRIVIPRRPS